MLVTADLHAHYGASHIVQGVDLAVGAGEVVGVFGRNGVGKTTLLKTIAGWIRASRGEIRFDGTRIDGAAADRICRLGVGFVPEDRRIFPGLTVEENLTLGFMQVPRRGGAANRAALAEIYRRFPRLHERRRQHGTTLSGGEQQMLAIARVLIGDAAPPSGRRAERRPGADDGVRDLCHPARIEAGAAAPSCWSSRMSRRR